MRITLFVIVCCLWLTVTLLPLAVDAVERPLPTLGGVGPAGGKGTLCDFDNPVSNYICYLYWTSLVGGGVLAFGLIVWGGLLYITSAGNPSQQQNARAWIGSAVLGLLLLLGAYIILNTINPELVALKFPTLKPPPQITVPSLPPGSRPPPVSTPIPGSTIPASRFPMSQVGQQPDPQLVQQCLAAGRQTERAPTIIGGRGCITFCLAPGERAQNPTCFD